VLLLNNLHERRRRRRRKEAINLEGKNKILLVSDFEI
jgi:hypothetical protein